MGSTMTWRLFSTKGHDMLDTLWRLAAGGWRGRLGMTSPSLGQQWREPRKRLVSEADQFIEPWKKRSSLSRPAPRERHGQREFDLYLHVRGISPEGERAVSGSLGLRSRQRRRA